MITDTKADSDGARLALGIDQYARIKQAMRIQGRLGRPKGSGK